jgi:hypothetical protein
MKKLVSEQPYVPGYSLSLAASYARLAWLDWLESRWDDSLESLRESVGLYENLITQSPDNAKYVLPATLPISFLAGALRERSQNGEARSLLEKTVRRLEQLSPGDTAQPHVRGAMSLLYGQLADLYGDLHETELADEARKKADALRPPGSWPPSRRPTSAPAPGGRRE